MTNSIRRSKHYNFVSGSNSKWKKSASRKLRRINKVRTQFGLDPLSHLINDLWDSPADGSSYYDPDLIEPNKALIRAAIRYKLIMNPDKIWDTRKTQRK